MVPFGLLSDNRAMNAPDKPTKGEEPKPKLSRQEEVLRIIEEYAAGLREMIKKLRRKLN